MREEAQTGWHKSFATAEKHFEPLMANGSAAHLEIIKLTWKYKITDSLYIFFTHLIEQRPFLNQFSSSFYAFSEYLHSFLIVFTFTHMCIHCLGSLHPSPPLSFYEYCVVSMNFQYNKNGN
jgi:hypothetical protein